MAASHQPEQDPTGTAVAVVEKNKILRFLDSPEAKSRILPQLGNNGRFDQVKVEVWSAIQQNPEIAECTPASMVQAISNAVGTGLIIGKGVHLVPFNTKVSKRGEPDQWEKRLQAILDYKGKVELIVRTGAARSIDAKCVYANEVFEYEEGLEQKLRHVPITDPAKRGKMIGAYAIARLSFGIFKTMFVPIDEIEAIRAKSKSWAPKSYGNKTVNEECPYWYALKTVVHRIAKELPATPRLALALRQLQAMDEDELLPLEIPAGGEGETSMEYRLNPAYPGRALADSGDSPFEPGHRPRGLGVEHRVVTSADRPDPALIANHASQPDPYGLDDARPAGGEPEFDFVVDDEPLPHEAPKAPAAEAFVMPFGPEKDKPLGAIETPALKKYLNHAKRAGFEAAFQTAAADVLRARGEG